MTATPYNLLTEKGRFSDRKIGYNPETEKFEKVHFTTEERGLTSTSRLYDIQWSLGYNDDYKEGRKLRLRV